MTNSKPADKRLLALSAEAFPRNCPCGKETYHTAEDYLAKTQKINGHSGIKAIDDEGDNYLEIFRNCKCGSTLLELFEDRRESNNERKLFQEKLNKLLEQGYSEDEARSIIRDKK